MREIILPESRLARFVFALAMPAANSLYVLSNRLIADRGRAGTWESMLDAHIPFIAAAIIPYAWWYIQILASLVWFIASEKSPHILYRYVASIVLVTLVSTLIFLSFPTRMERPVVTGDDIFSRLVRYLYHIDEPYNCFPSLHVAYSLIASVFWQKAGPQRLWFKAFTWGSFILISLATVLTKQHYYPDIPGGIFAALLSLALVELVYRKFVRQKPAGCP